MGGIFELLEPVDAEAVAEDEDEIGLDTERLVPLNGRRDDGTAAVSADVPDVVSTSPWIAGIGRRWRQCRIQRSNRPAGIAAFALPCPSAGHMFPCQDTVHGVLRLGPSTQGPVPPPSSTTASHPLARETCF